MTRIVLALAVGFVLFFVLRADAQQAPRTIFAVDVSGSSTFLFDPNSANAAGAVVETYIAGLDHPHELAMVSIGDAGLPRRIIDIRATVTKSRASSARRLAPQFGGYFRSLPSLVKNGTIAPQQSTSLIDFLQSLETVCASGNATVVIFSDGVEWSSSVEGGRFASGNLKLPKPDRAFLDGCEVRLLGVGQVRSELDANGLAGRLIPQWRDFLAAAGAEPVTVAGSGFSF